MSLGQVFFPDRRGVVHVGSRRGKVAIYLTKEEAIDLACHYGVGDLAYDEIMRAVEAAYPHDEGEAS